MVVISLDQNFLWEFYTKKHHNASRLFALLESAVKADKAVCPVHSHELVEEGSKAPPDKRSGIFQTASALCSGKAFRDFSWSISDETLQLVRPGYKPQRLTSGTLAPPQDIDGLGIKVRKGVKIYEARLHQSPNPPPGFSNNMDAWGIYHEILKWRCASMLRLTQAIRDRRPLETGFSEWEFALGAAFRLQKIGIETNECERLIALICERQWEQTPTLLWHSRLCAQLEFEHLRSTRKTDPNDYFDLTRLAVGLTDADVVLCDRPMSNLIQNTGFCGAPSFSWSTSTEAIQYLETLFKD